MTDGIEAFKQRDTFSLTDFLSDKKYPTEEVTVFTDTYSMNERLKIQETINQNNEEIAKLKVAIDRNGPRTVGEADQAILQQQSDVDVLVKLNEALRERFQPLDEAIQASALTFKLEGLPPYVVESISDKHFTDRKKNYTNTPEEDARDLELIASTVRSVETADGKVKDTFEVDDVKALKAHLADGEYYKLVSGVAHVNLNGAMFDQAVDAPFLSRRSNVAG